MTGRFTDDGYEPKNAQRVLAAYELIGGVSAESTYALAYPIFTTTIGELND